MPVRPPNKSCCKHHIPCQFDFKTKSPVRITFRPSLTTKLVSHSMLVHSVISVVFMLISFKWEYQQNHKGTARTVLIYTLQLQQDHVDIHSTITARPCWYTLYNYSKTVLTYTILLQRDCVDIHTKLQQDHIDIHYTITIRLNLTHFNFNFIALITENFITAVSNSI